MAEWEGGGAGGRYFSFAKKDLVFTPREDMTAEDLAYYYGLVVTNMKGDYSRKEVVNELINSHKYLRDLNFERKVYISNIPSWKSWIIENILDVKLK